MRKVASKYDEFLSRLYVAVSRVGDVEVLVDRTDNFENPTLYIKSEDSIDDELYSNVVATIKTCGHKIVSKKRMKKKISIKIGVTK